jgi:diguanylate cyclase (GGDEF)-like protein
MPSANQQAAGLSSVRSRTAMVLVMLGGLWLAIWWLSRVLEYAPHASLWYPPAALSYALFRQFGWRAAPVVVIASIIATFLAGEDYQSGLGGQTLLVAGLLYALAHGGPYFLAARVMTHIAPTGSSRSAPRTTIAFLLVSSMSSLLAAILGVTSLALTGIIGWNDATEILVPWWIGDFAALLALGPPLTALIGRLTLRLKLDENDLVPPQRYLYRSGRPLRPLMIKLAAAGLMITVSAALASLFPAREPLAFLVFFVIIPQMWIVHSEGAMRGLISVAVISTSLVLAILIFGLADRALIYQFAMIIIAASAYFGLAVPMLYADNEELRELVTTDTLTGTASRHQLMAVADQEIQRARRYQEPISLIAFDIDHFKQINDSGGHSLGDRVLIAATRSCRRVLRGSDLLARIGGDEFVVLLPSTALMEAKNTAERVCEAISGSKLLHADDVSISASVGVVEIDLTCESWQQAFDRADRALYRAKRGGRNRVEAA